jgi:hypothetical protein
MNEEEAWIIGFIEASGCFTKNKLKIGRKTKNGIKIYRYFVPVFFLVNQDVSALEIARRILGLGRVARHGRSYRLEIRRKREVMRLVRLLDGRLRSDGKKQQFEEWKRLVLQWKRRGRVL